MMITGIIQIPIAAYFGVTGANKKKSFNPGVQINKQISKISKTIEILR